MHRALVATAAVVVIAGSVTTATAVARDRGPSTAHAELRLADGTDVGDVRFRKLRDTTRVSVSLAVPTGVTAARAFHGFHVHANNDPANGEGCVADPGQPPSTWFVSADGHLARPGETHGNHAGDMPVLHLDADGTAETTFEIDRFTVAELVGGAVILHAGADNYANVPVGAGPNQYMPNSAQATDLTSRTGNAGDRVACGEIDTN